ncbi:MAG: uracil-DNA glycosylase family protein, partial [Pseudomonadota bacterium]|nr:uracil-DNA glycosylase family protein [Pseudomonadota bacterium]
MPDTLESLFRDIRACTNCEARLPMGARPVVRGTATARVCIIGQAPGIRVHRSGKPWDDPSGKRLRGWLEVKDDTFYDESQF